ncbi:uncharacterized protein [Ptychodera flava]|uniref:uncharacterized protein n=1 Tax=Ptychodera flava TaxID=63121 RepID=UPI00396A781C
MAFEGNETSFADRYIDNIENFRGQLRRYFEEVKSLPRVSDAELKNYLDETYQDLSNSFDRMFALDELFYFVIGFKDEIVTALERDEHCKKAGHAATLDQLITSMAENPYEQIPSKYESLYAKPLVHYESLHQMSDKEADYQDLHPVSEPTYTSLVNDKQRLPGDPSLQSHSEYQTLQPGPLSEYATLQSEQQPRRQGETETESHSVYQP